MTKLVRPAFRRVSWLLCAVGLDSGAASAGCSSPSSPAGPEQTTSDASSPARIVLDGGGNVPAAPHGEELCPQGSCNYQTGAGCSRDAGPVSCVPLPSGPEAGVAPACESAGAVPNGGTCTQWTDCAPGTVCAAGRCHKLCCGQDWTGCTDGEHCLRPFAIEIGKQTVATGAYLCFPVNDCDALRPEMCAAREKGTTCQIADPTGATACLPEGAGGEYDPCPSCRGGYTCVGDRCRRLCKATLEGGEPSCASDDVCIHYNRDPAGVGECTPPLR
ncbi:MAG TPA: hypothetical protein VJT73_04105 [Polyangiaceae bacterium]|nr:hypothetical protein [Polyangiaceae bacterium]